MQCFDVRITTFSLQIVIKIYNDFHVDLVVSSNHMEH